MSVRLEMRWDWTIKKATRAYGPSATQVKAVSVVTIFVTALSRVVARRTSRRVHHAPNGG